VVKRRRCPHSDRAHFVSKGGERTFAASASHPSREVGSRPSGHPKLGLALRCRNSASSPNYKFVSPKRERAAGCMIIDAAVRQRGRPFAQSVMRIKWPAYGLRNKMIPELDAVKKSIRRYNAALPLVPKTPYNTCCEKRHRSDAHNGGPRRRIKHIRRAQTNDGGQHPDHTSGDGHAFGRP
jgi:hypothetical protein